MILEIMAVIIIGLAAVIHYRAGLWAAVLSLWVVLVAGAVAFGLFLPMSGLLFVTDPLKTSYYWADGLCLLLVFTAALALLRLLAERFLRNSMTFRPQIDTIAGPVVGALAGYFLAGMLVVFAQMMPLPPTVMGYRPFALEGKPGARAGHLVGRYDDAVLGLYNSLLGGPLGGGQGNLAAHYPAADPSRAPGVKNRFRGATVDDILYHYFRRRTRYALLSTKGAGVYTGGREKGVPLVAGRKARAFSPRRQPGTEIKIEKVWMTPLLAWSDPAGQAVVVAPGEITWVPGGAEEAKKAKKTNESFLMVQVKFRPSKSEPRNILLRDWHLDNVLQDRKRKGSRNRQPPTSPPRMVRLWMSARTKGPLVMPDDPSLKKKGQVSQLDLKTVAAGVEKPDGDRSRWPAEGRTEILVRDADWTFVDNRRWVRATLVFPVPSLSAPWQYGLECSSQDFVATTGRGRGRGKPQGLSAGGKLEFGPLKAEILSAGPFSRLGSKLPLKAVRGKELMQVRLKLVKISGKGRPKSLLLTAKELRITDKAARKDYPASLYETLSATKGAIVGDVTARKADYTYGDAQLIEPADGEKGERLSKQWQVYFESSSSSIILRLVFEVPRGRPLGRFGLKTVGRLGQEAPDWYLKKHAEKISPRTHRVVVLEQGAVESIPRLLSRGRVKPYRLAAGGAQDLLVVKVSIQPKKEKDERRYYMLNPQGVGLRLSSRSFKTAIPFLFFRGPGEKNFASSRRARPVVVHGLTTVEFAFAAPRERKKAWIVFPGLRPAPLETSE